MQRNGERYEFLKWGAQAFDNFQVVPPGTGICHQVNLEYISQCVWTGEDAERRDASPTPTHWSAPTATRPWSTAWACSAGASAGSRPRRRCSASRSRMLIPEVVGFRLDGELKEGITATDLVLTVTQMLRAEGRRRPLRRILRPGPRQHDASPTARRSPTWRPNMARPAASSRSTSGRIDYLELTGRDPERIALVQRLCQAQGLWRDASTPEPVFTDTLELDMSTIEPSLAGPKRPQDRVLLSEVDDQFNAELEQTYKKHNDPRVPVEGENLRSRQRRRRHRRDHQLHQHLEPVGAGRRRARRPQGAREGPAEASRGSRPASRREARWSPTISTKAASAEDLNALGFDLVGYGCTTCIGNSGPLARADQQGDQRKGPGRGQRPFGQPQFRRPRVARLPRQLSRLAAAGRRLCAQGHGARRT